jgi:lipoate-protein ligase B
MVASRLDVLHLGLVEYSAALEFMEGRRAARARDEVPDTLLLLEHPPVITFGANGGQSDLLCAAELYSELGIDLVRTNRGGRATFHGPGQLVVYPVIKLADLDLHGFLWRLEEAAVRLLAKWEIHAGRNDQHPGVWVGKRKIAAIGLAVRDGVTSHGMALNVNVDLSYFQLINPCGIRGCETTSMQVELGEPLPMAQIEERFLSHFAGALERDFTQAS